MIFLLVLICFVLGVSFPVVAQNSTIETLEDQAYMWMQRGREDKAAEAWRKLLLSEPKHTTALSELAVHAVTTGAQAEAQLRLHELEEADPRDGRLAFVRAILQRGDEVAAELRKARLHSKAGRTDEALQHYWKAFGEIEPTTLSGLEYYQVLAATADSWNAVRTGLERLAQLYPKAAHVQLALALHLTYLPTTRTRGISLLQQLAGMPAISNETHAGWRQAVMWLGESPEALPWLRSYVSANPLDNELRQRLELLEPRLARQEALRQGFKALEAGELGLAEQKFKSIPGTECDSEALVGLASVALAGEAFDKAAKLLHQAQELAPQRPELWQPLLHTAELWQAIKRAEMLRREGQLDKAQTVLEHAANTTAPERYQAVLSLVEVLLDRGDLPRARQSLHELLVAPPNDTSSLRRLVLLLLRANLDEQASTVNKSLSDIDAAAAFRPEGLRAEQLRLRALYLRQSGDIIAARDSLVVATSLDPHASQAWIDLVNLDLELGDLEQSQRSVEALLKSEPELPEAVLVAARLAEQRDEPDRALKLLRAIDEPATTEEIIKLRRRLEVRISAAKAVRTFKIGGVSAARLQLSALERVAPNPTHLAIVAEAWAEIGELDHAVLLLHAGETTSAEVTGVRLQMAGLLLRAGRTGETMAVLEELAARPGLVPAELTALHKLRIGCIVRMADSLRSQGDLEGARSELIPWTGARPLEPQIANAYGRVLHDAGNCQAAAEQFTRVLKHDPGDFDALQGLTYAALNGGSDLFETRQALQQGLLLHADDPRLHLFIARLDAKAESYTGALKELAQARRLVENDVRSDIMHASHTQKMASPPSQPRHPEAELELLRSEIHSETQRVQAAAGTKLRPEMTMRSREGVPGRQALFELTAPSRMEFPNSWGTLSLQVTPTHLSAGQLVLSEGPDTTPFGTIVGVAVGERDIEAEGIALGMGYGYRGWQLDVGVTPVNFARSTVVGGLRWKRAFHDVSLTLEASRRAVEESVLSFAGVSDPGTGSVWGGVVKQGGAVTLRNDGRTSRSYAILDYNYLTGTDVEPNHSLSAHLGLQWELQRSRNMRIETGIAVSAMAFERNLSEFSYGHGGYFSPQRFVHFGLPIDWQGSYQAVTWRLALVPGVTWFQIDEAPYFPLEASTQASDQLLRYPSRESLGLGVDGGLELGYVLTSQMTLGARAELHTGDDYREICASAFLRFALKGGDNLLRGD